MKREKRIAHLPFHTEHENIQYIHSALQEKKYISILIGAVSSFFLAKEILLPCKCGMQIRP